MRVGAIGPIREYRLSLPTKLAQKRQKSCCKGETRATSSQLNMFRNNRFRRRTRFGDAVAFRLLDDFGEILVGQPREHLHDLPHQFLGRRIRTEAEMPEKEGKGLIHA